MTWLGVGTTVLIVIVLIAVIPLITAAMQTLTVFFQSKIYLRNIPPISSLPRVSVLVPAWNEAAVLTSTVTRLINLDYPTDSLRVVVIDDASTDDTKSVMKTLKETYGDSVQYVHREVGGQGKAHTLNAGLDSILSNDWTQAVLITDADVLFTPLSLERMVRHLGDPNIGAVTAYVKEGSSPGTWITRSIRYEYATAQAAARRAQNVIVTQGCLAGGAQLHSRENIERLGGRIDTNTLAEDTVTTMETQISGYEVVFEPHADVYAEEPGSLQALWGQRMRWARGNLQVTARYFRYMIKPRGRLSNPLFTIPWFAVLAQPFLILSSTFALIGLSFLDTAASDAVFRAIWIISIGSYLIIYAGVIAVDKSTAKRAWLEGIMFPGIISLWLMVRAVFPDTSLWVAEQLSKMGANAYDVLAFQTTFGFLWLSLSMGVAYLAVKTESFGRVGAILSRVLLLLCGYGAVLVAVGAGAAWKQLVGDDTQWVKTEKTGTASLDGGKS
jgi:cellulose synthase/poly-beta-1,6-N-acetylglucosamine synthase-like glycosyltransferase